MNLTNKIYDCLVTPLRTAFETIIHNITQGSTIIGDQIFKYTLFKDNLETIGCFMYEDEMCEVRSLYHEIKRDPQSFNHTSGLEMLKEYCSITEMQLIGLIPKNVKKITQGAVNLIQTYIINGSNVNITEDGKAIIHGSNYTVNNSVFAFNGIPTFFGFNGDDCNNESVIKFIWNYSVSKISNTKWNYSAARNIQQFGSFTDSSFSQDVLDAYFPEDINDRQFNPEFHFLSAISGFMVAVVGIGMGYVLYKLFTSKYNYDKVTTLDNNEQQEIIEERYKKYRHNASTVDQESVYLDVISNNGDNEIYKSLVGINNIVELNG